MAGEIRIPKLGMSATEMTLLEWMFEDGDEVSQGEVIYTVETDTTSTEVEAKQSGVIHATGVEGEVYQVGDLIGTIE